jgi:hypothetical protein
MVRTKDSKTKDYGEYRRIGDYRKWILFVKEAEVSLGRGNAFGQLYNARNIEGEEVNASSVEELKRKIDQHPVKDSKTKDASSDEYIVNVGNIGNIVCASEQEALKTFDEYVRQSKSTSGRAAGEDVVLFKNGYPIKDFVGSRSRRQLY